MWGSLHRQSASLTVKPYTEVTPGGNSMLVIIICNSKLRKIIGRQTTVCVYLYAKSWAGDMRRRGVADSTACVFCKLRVRLYFSAEVKTTLTAIWLCMPWLSNRVVYINVLLLHWTENTTQLSNSQSQNNTFRQSNHISLPNQSWRPQLFSLL